MIQDHIGSVLLSAEAILHYGVDSEQSSVYGT